MKSRKILLLALCFETLLGSAALAAEYVADQPVRVSGPSPLDPDCDSGPAYGRINFRNYEVEPYVAVDPHNGHNMVVSWQQDRWSAGGSNATVSAVSHDGGLTWKQSLFPGTTRCSDGSFYYRAGDDWLSFAKNGDLYHSLLAFNYGTNESGVAVSKSTNGGETWGEPVFITQDVYPAVNDKESITADPHDADYVYATWDKTEVGETSSKVTGWFSRTTDGGKTWEPARRIFDMGPGRDFFASQILVLPKGDLVLVFTYMGSKVALVRSGDRGETWGPVEVISDLKVGTMRDPTTGDLMASGASIVDAAVDARRGTLYVTWIDTRFDGITPAVALAKSTDGGRTWSDPIRVNAASAAAFTPSVTVAKDGTVGVSYFDVRNDTSDPATFPADHWLVTSHDGGASWKETHIAGPFNVNDTPYRSYPTFKVRMLGDYMGLAASNNSFVAAYAMPTGDPLNPTDVFVSVLKKTDGEEGEGQR